MTLVIGLSGRIGAGKGTVAEHLKEKYGAKDIVFSNILKDVLERLDIPVTRYSLQQLGRCLRDGLGADVLVKAMKGDIEKKKAKVLLIDGVRYMNEAKLVKSFPKHTLLFLDAPLEMRYKRVVKRGTRGEAAMSFADFKKKDNAPTEAEIPDVREFSDFVIENTGTIKELRADIDEIINPLI
jgi:dephospho-CoA kinase